MKEQKYGVLIFPDNDEFLKFMEELQKQYNGDVNMENNIYHRTSNQLKEHLQNHGFSVDSVSRVFISDQTYYHIEFNLSLEDWRNSKTGYQEISKLLKIKYVGLVDFHEYDNMIHEIILVSESELNAKYLKNGNLVF